MKEMKEVVHAHWTSLYKGASYRGEQCSNCKEEFECNFNYCPNCGAKMEVCV